MYFRRSFEANQMLDVYELHLSKMTVSQEELSKSLDVVSFSARAQSFLSTRFKGLLAGMVFAHWESLILFANYFSAAESFWCHQCNLRHGQSFYSSWLTLWVELAYSIWSFFCHLLVPTSASGKAGTCSGSAKEHWRWLWDV